MTNQRTGGQCGVCENCAPQINGGSGFNNCEEAYAAQLTGDAVINNRLTDEQLNVAIEFVHNRYKAAKINGHMLMTDESIILSALLELQEYRNNYKWREGIKNDE